MANDENSRVHRTIWLLEELKVPYDVEIFRRNPSTFLAPPELAKVHTLGKSPVVSVTPPGEGAEPLMLAESGFISTYLCDHFPEGKRLVPQKWKDGMEGKFGGETEEWLRYEFLMHYAEGSLMPPLVMSLVFKMKAGSPFLVRPLVNMIADRVMGLFVVPTLRKHLKFLEDQLSTSSGDYLCGKTLTAADILVSYGPIKFDKMVDELATWEGGSWRNTHPKVAAYLDKMQTEPGYVKTTQKVKEYEGK
ncbi:palmitoyltransferase ERF2 [Sarocladium implicatum]|nr:palmitoyltransferase ERF2 [Sarocladium implicatum]